MFWKVSLEAEFSQFNSASPNAQENWEVVIKVIRHQLLSIAYQNW